MHNPKSHDLNLLSGLTVPDSRRYLPRIWQVPKDKGGLFFFATLCIKALIKHGWPACFKIDGTHSFIIGYHAKNRADSTEFDEMPPDFQNAIAQCVFVVARQHKIDQFITVLHGRVEIAIMTTVKSGGFLAPCTSPYGYSCVCEPDAEFFCSRKKWVK